MDGRKVRIGVVAGGAGEILEALAKRGRKVNGLRRGSVDMEPAETERLPVRKLGMVARGCCALAVMLAAVSLARGQAMGKAEVDSTGLTVGGGSSSLPLGANGAGSNGSAGGISRVESVLGGGGLSMPAVNLPVPVGGGGTALGGGVVPVGGILGNGTEAIGPVSFAPVKEPVASPATVPAGGNSGAGGASGAPDSGPKAGAKLGGAEVVGGNSGDTNAVATTKPASNPIEDKPIRHNETAAAASDGVNNAGTGGYKSWAGLGGLAQVGMALMVVIGLILVFRALARKFVPGAGTKDGKGVIEILARHPLARNQSIVLVRIGSQIVALNQRKDSSSSILVISDPAEVARVIGQIEGTKPGSSMEGFGKLLANARMDLEKQDEPEDGGEEELRGLAPEKLDEELEEMASAKRQLMELRQHVRSVRDSLPRT